MATGSNALELPVIQILSTYRGEVFSEFKTKPNCNTHKRIPWQVSRVTLDNDSSSFRELSCISIHDCVTPWRFELTVILLFLGKFLLLNRCVPFLGISSQSGAQLVTSDAPSLRWSMSTLNKNRFQGGVPTFVPSLSSCRTKRGQDPGNEVEYMLNRFAIERRN